MKILVLNCGSSSLRYQLIDMKDENVLCSGKYERIGEQEAFITHKVNGEKIKIDNAVKNHEEALSFIMEQLLHNDYGVIKSLDEIDSIGHRIVHGGQNFIQSTIVNDEVVKGMEDCIELDPLHNEPAVAGLKACIVQMPGKPNTLVFDTAFHQTIPEERYIFPIPYKYYEKYGLRKYGFHGTSHMFVSTKLDEITGKKNAKVVTCHIGQGASVCAVENGKSVETSMGFTPVAGIPMVARSGDLDPSVVTYIMKKEGITDPQVMEDILNKESGATGISGLAPDFRVIEEASRQGNKRAMLAMNSYNYLIACYIARCAVAMNGIDTIVFTGGIGENQIGTRKGICDNLKFLGVELDLEANNVRGEDTKISSKESKIDVWVIPTDEELMIAKETMRLLNENK